MTRPEYTPDSVLVVGGGLAGYHVAYALRRRGFDGSLRVLGAETHPAYDRPPLSKAFLDGTLGEGDLGLDNPDAPLDVEWVRGVAAAGLVPTPTGAAVVAADGSVHEAGAVVLATGAEAIRIGHAMPGAFVLRTLDDARAVRAHGLTGRRVVVVGTGFIGLEVAAAATSQGAVSVTVVGPEHAPLAERFGTVVGEAVQRLHERHGVRFRCASTVSELVVDERGHAAGVRLADGEIVPADLVLIGVGARPATAWLRDETPAPMRFAPDGAVLCDANGRTGVERVWALGDCSRWVLDATTPARGGHWQDALDHAAIVAADLLGDAAPALPEPYGWSDQFDVRIQFAGHLDGDETPVVLDGSIETADLLVTWLRHGVETAVLGMGRPRDVTKWRRTRTQSRARTAA